MFFHVNLNFVVVEFSDARIGPGAFALLMPPWPCGGVLWGGCQMWVPGSLTLLGVPAGNRDKVKFLRSLSLVVSNISQRKFQGCPGVGAICGCQELVAPLFGRKPFTKGPEKGWVPDGPLVILSKAPSAGTRLGLTRSCLGCWFVCFWDPEPLHFGCVFL